jgi:DNA-binding CsgD family transcriptional regulator
MSGVIVLLIALFLSGRIKVKRSIVLFTLTAQLELVGEMVYGIRLNTLFACQLTLANMVFCHALVIVAAITYVRYLPVMLAVVSLIAFGLSCWLMQDKNMISFFPVLGSVILLSSILGEVIYRRIRTLEKENRECEEEMLNVSNFLRIDRNELRKLIGKMKPDSTEPEQTTYVLKLLGKRSEELLLRKAQQVLSMERRSIPLLLDKFPSITPAEREICSLILQGKSILGISELTGKSVSNITSTRSHIRQKLGLDKSANLKDELMKITTAG